MNKSEKSESILPQGAMNDAINAVYPLIPTDGSSVGQRLEIAKAIVEAVLQATQQSEGPTPHELRQRIAEISRGGDIEFGPPTDYDYALADAVLKALGHTKQAERLVSDADAAYVLTRYMEKQPEIIYDFMPNENGIRWMREAITEWLNGE